MIDVESEIFDTVASVLRTQFPGIYVTGETINTLKSFPCASIIEEDNSTHTPTIDDAESENHSEILWEVNVYSNLKNLRKTQAKSIMAVIDTEFQKLGFVRVGSSPMEIPSENAYHRRLARYRTLIGTDKVTYRR